MIGQDKATKNKGVTATGAPTIGTVREDKMYPKSTLDGYLHNESRYFYSFKDTYTPAKIVVLNGKA